MKLKYHGVVISNVGRRWRRWWRCQRMAAAAEAEAEAAVLAEFEAAFEAAVPEDRLCRCGHLCAAVHKFCTMCGTHRDWSPVETRVEDEDLDAAESEEAEVEDEVEAEVCESQLAGLESDRLRREEIMATCRTEMDRSRNYNYQPASRAVVNYRSAAAVVDSGDGGDDDDEAFVDQVAAVVENGWRVVVVSGQGGDDDYDYDVRRMAERRWAMWRSGEVVDQVMDMAAEEWRRRLRRRTSEEVVICLRDGGGGDGVVSEQEVVESEEEEVESEEVVDMEVVESEEEVVVEVGDGVESDWRWWMFWTMRLAPL